jgi:hypothetical protein
MARHHDLLMGAYYGIRAAKAIGRSLGLASPNSLRVLLYHDIAPEDREGFATQLHWLSRSWKFVPVDLFAAMIAGDEPVRGRNLLLSFDDGFASNRAVAEQVLNPLGIRAVFFVVSDFISLVDREEARDFIVRHIQPGRRVEELPHHLRNMSWSDLEMLLEQGHCIGGHTRTHAKLSSIHSQLRVPIEHFAYTFGDLESFSPSALAIARRRFSFVYSGLRGDNTKLVSPYALRRDAVTPQDSLDLLGAYLEGAADFRYARSRARLNTWAEAI